MMTRELLFGWSTLNHRSLHHIFIMSPFVLVIRIMLWDVVIFLYISRKEWMMGAFYKGLSPATQADMLHFADPLVAALSSAGSLPISPVGCRFSQGTEEKIQGS